MESYSELKENEYEDMEETWMNITKWKKPIWTGYLMWDSNDMRFWKRQNHGDSKKIGGCQGLVGERVINRWAMKPIVWYYNGEHVITLYVKTQNKRRQEWPQP